MNKKITYKHFISVGNQMKGYDQNRQSLIEAIDIVSERNPEFPKHEFIQAVAEGLHHNGIIKEPTLMDLCVLDTRIMGKFNRNWRMLDLLDAIASFYMIRETLPIVEPIPELEPKTNVVSLRKSASER